VVRSTLDELELEDGDEVELEIDGARYTLVRRPDAERDAEPMLSPREREIARMVALGYTTKTIAAVLEISAWTVGTHIRRIFNRLGVHSRSAMVAQLVACGQIAAENADWSPLWRSDEHGWRD
jgi:DNA-binding CsgD family transcriptional regulator